MSTRSDLARSLSGDALVFSLALYFSMASDLLSSLIHLISLPSPIVLLFFLLVATVRSPLLQSLCVRCPGSAPQVRWFVGPLQRDAAQMRGEERKEPAASSLRHTEKVSLRHTAISCCHVKTQTVPVRGERAAGLTRGLVLVPAQVNSSTVS